jgi:hypothetical protein
MGVHSRDPIHPAIVANEASFDEVQSLMETGPGEDWYGEEPRTWEQAADVGLKIGATPPTAAKPDSPKTLLADMLRRTNPDFTDAQVRHAVAKGVGFLDNKKVTKQGLPDLVSLLAKQERELEAAGQRGGPAPSALTLADVEATQRLSEYLRAEVEIHRVVLFRSPHVPFGSPGDALAWMKREAGQHALEQSELEALQGQLQALDAGPGSPIRVAQEQRTVWLRDPRPHAPNPRNLPLAHAVPAGRSWLLGYLSDAQRHLSQQVGVQEWDITSLILLGIPPAVYRWQPRLPHPNLLFGKSGMLYWFSLEIRDPRCSFEEIRELFGLLVQEGFLTSTTSSASHRDKLRRVLEFVEARRELQSVPMTWADIAPEWCAANPDEPYTLRGIKKAYRDALELFGLSKPVVRRGRRQDDRRPAQGQHHRPPQAHRIQTDPRPPRDTRHQSSE